ncbi:MAG: TetR/AcrR family transcriptional regulator [Pseudomonadales bacterium]
MPEINTLVPQEQLEYMSRRDRKKQETRWRIYDAAIALISKLGYEDVKIEDICAAADVSNAAFFHHFSNKAALIGAYVDKLKLEIKNKLDETPEASAREKLETINQEVASSSQSTAAFTPQLFAALTSGDSKLDMEHIDTGITGTLAQIIKDGQDNGEFSKEWHPEIVAVSLTASWIIMPLAKEGPRFPSDPYSELLSLMLAGLTTS